jgi:hypothetical protein
MWNLILNVQLLLSRNLCNHVFLLKTWSHQLIIFFNLMGAWEPLLPRLGSSDIEFPFESDLTICRSSIPCACDYSLIDSSSPGQNLHPHMEYGQFSMPFGTVDPPRSRDFSDIELSSDEAILEETLGHILAAGST